ncbi:unnamed protein product [Amoebophrya sp. A120]|nr:unnamed protein product [Amoebophrya sp. A120]|eukprot:GSA120T00019983001.1
MFFDQLPPAKRRRKGSFANVPASTPKRFFFALMPSRWSNIIQPSRLVQRVLVQLLPLVPLLLLQNIHVAAYTTKEHRSWDYTNWTISDRVEVFSTDQFPQYSCYKIPYLFQTLNGTILAFAEARGPTDDKSSIGNCMDWDITDVVLRKSYDGGHTWSPMTTLLRGRYDWHFVVGNLAPVQDEFSGRILLPFTRGNSRMWLTFSDSQGESWADPYRLNYEGFWWTWVGFGPPAGLQMSYSKLYRGRLIIPGYFSDSPVFDLTAIFASSAFLLISDDGGANWERVIVSNGNQELIPGIAGNEDQVTEMCDGSLLLNMRTWIGDRVQSWSYDGGKSWSVVERTALPNPFQGCQGSVVSLNKHVQLYSGLGPPESDWDAVRKDLKLWTSEDGGRNWVERMIIHEGGASYSALWRLLDGRIAVIYEIGNLSPIFIPLNIYVKILPPLDEFLFPAGGATVLPDYSPADTTSFASMGCAASSPRTAYRTEPRRFWHIDGTDAFVPVSSTGVQYQQQAVLVPSGTGTTSSTNATLSAMINSDYPTTWRPFQVHSMDWQQRQKSRFDSSSFMFSFTWWVVMLLLSITFVLSLPLLFLSSMCCCLPTCRQRRSSEFLIVAGGCEGNCAAIGGNLREKLASLKRTAATARDTNSMKQVVEQEDEPLQCAEDSSTAAGTTRAKPERNTGDTTSATVNMVDPRREEQVELANRKINLPAGRSCSSSCTTTTDVENIKGLQQQLQDERSSCKNKRQMKEHEHDRQQRQRQHDIMMKEDAKWSTSPTTQPVNMGENQNHEGSFKTLLEVEQEASSCLKTENAKDFGALYLADKELQAGEQEKQMRMPCKESDLVLGESESVSITSVNFTDANSTATPVDQETDQTSKTDLNTIFVPPAGVTKDVDDENGLQLQKYYSATSTSPGDEKNPDERLSAATSVVAVLKNLSRWFRDNQNQQQYLLPLLQLLNSLWFGFWACGALYDSAQLPLVLISHAKYQIHAFPPVTIMHDKFWQPKQNYTPAQICHAKPVLLLDWCLYCRSRYTNEGEGELCILIRSSPSSSRTTTRSAGFSRPTGAFSAWRFRSSCAC